MYRLADAVQRIFDPLYKSERAPCSTAPVRSSHDGNGDQNVALNSTPQVRGSLRKPVRLLKSMAPTIASSSVMLRP
jgi:hypothetical protein